MTDSNLGYAINCNQYQATIGVHGINCNYVRVQADVIWGQTENDLMNSICNRIINTVYLNALSIDRKHVDKQYLKQFGTRNEQIDYHTFSMLYYIRASVSNNLFNFINFSQLLPPDCKGVKISAYHEYKYMEVVLSTFRRSPAIEPIIKPLSEESAQSMITNIGENNMRDLTQKLENILRDVDDKWKTQQNVNEKGQRDKDMQQYMALKRKLGL